MANKDGKTEKPTPKKREEARKGGQIARSTELNSALILLVSFWGIRALGPHIMNTITQFVKANFQNFNSTAVNQQTVPSIFFSILVVYLKIVAPIAGIILAVGLVASFAQVGFFFSSKNMKPKLDKLNPIKGVKQLFSADKFVDLIKSVVKVVLLGSIAYSVLSNKYSELVGLIDMDIYQSLQFLGNMAYELGMKIGFAMLILAIFDYAYQRYSHEKKLRMSKQEIKEEAKQMQGDPKIKSKIRQKQIQMALSRMMQDVPNADVIITNPIHLAVALKYDPENMAAPRVVAKGQRLIAEKIKEIAEANRIPIVEDVFLAQSLHKSVEIGQDISLELYKAVAEILAYVYQLSQRKVV